jgi:L-rhamnose isomerase
MESRQMKKILLFSVLVISAPLTIGSLQAADQVQAQAQEQIYGSQLMTQKERNDLQAKMHAAKTEQERERIRNLHHKRMVQRAKERGVTLPAEPPMNGGGMGSGGMGSGGMGSGGSEH